MRTANLGSQASRTSDVGLVWKLLNNNTSTKQEIPKVSSLLITAVATCIVSLDGVNSVVLLANQTIVINVGPGNKEDNKESVTVEFTGAVNCSVAE